eukprot:scaffold601_cov170-Ochromonas_danica.AAC.14
MTYGHRLLSTSKQGGILSGVPILEEHLSRFFVQATIILGITRVLAFSGFYLKQPRVVFEIIGGVILGPSAIGRDQNFLPHIFPDDSLDYLDIVANIGLTLYLFLVGLELDPALLKSHARSAGGIAVVGMAVPFALGVGISKVMFNVLQGDDPAYKDVSFVSFFVFIGTAMSITAFPVLARLLKEGGLIYTPAGAMAMGAAALNDALAWCLLTLAISIANAGDMSTAGYVFLTVVGFALTLFIVIRPIFERIVVYVESLHRADMHSNLFVLTLCLLFMCAWTTALLGVHAIFGAFLFGLIVPRGSHLFKECNEKIEELVVSFTLPIYFALSGLKTDVTQIHTSEQGGIVVLVCVCATLGKYIGAGGTALLSGMSMRESAVIAALMNTRGLVELIVLNLGMSSGILSVRTFSVMVVMCLFTTFLTSPMVELIFPAEMRLRVLTKPPEEHHGEDSTNKDEDSSKGADDSALVAVEGVSVENYGRIAVVVDAVTQMQPLLNTLAFLAPDRLNSELCVTALHFIEPTYTAKDEFLALNEHGKLIRIDEETTDLSEAFMFHEDPSMKPPELLPMSAFCRAMQMPVNAFRIQGDPDEFPLELKSLARQNDCNIAFIPWKPNSLYMQKFIWHAVKVNDVPTVLVWEKEAMLLSTDGSEIGGESGRLRASSYISTNSHGFFNSSSKKADVASEDMHEIQGKPRSNTIFLPDGFAVAADNRLPGHSNHLHHPKSLYTNAPVETISHIRRGTIAKTITKLPLGPRSPKKVVAVLLGELADIVILSVLLRIAHNPQNEVHVLLPKDHDAFPQDNITAYSDFQHHAQESGLNIISQIMESISTDYTGMYDEACELPFDLILFSYVEPRDVDEAALLAASNGAVVRDNARGRAHTITVAGMEALRHAPNAGSLETRFLTGMPHRCVYSKLSHPELGKLGDLINEGKHTKSSLIWVFHEPEKARLYHNAWGGHTHTAGGMQSASYIPVPTDIIEEKSNEDEEEEEEGVTRYPHLSPEKHSSQSTTSTHPLSPIAEVSSPQSSHPPSQRVIQEETNFEGGSSLPLSSRSLAALTTANNPTGAASI